MEKKVDIGWGQGVSDVLIDLEDKTILPYVWKKDLIHHNCEGECYYSSWTGLTGSGYIIDFPYALKVPGWKNRGFYDHIKIDGGVYLSAWFPKHIDHMGKYDRVRLVLTLTYGTPYIIEVHPSDLMNLSDELDNLKESCDKYTTIVGSTSQPFFMSRSLRGLDAMTILKTLNLSSVNKAKDMWENRNILCPEATGLGLFGLAGGYMKQVSGHFLAENIYDYYPELYDWDMVHYGDAYQRVDGDVLGVAYLQKSKENPLKGNLIYFRKRKSHYNIISPIYGSHVGYEMRVDLIHFYNNQHDYIRKLEASTLTKERKQWLNWERARRRDEKLKEWVEANPEMEVTIRDSLDAGNCEPGTKRFRDQYFPGRDSVTVAELWEINNNSVRQVLLNLANKE